MRRYKLLEIFKSNYHYILLSILLLIIIITNIQVSRYVVGLDNMSPYFNAQGIISKALENEGIYILNFGPQILLLPYWEILKSLNIPVWAIIQIYLFSSLILGVFGISYLSRKVAIYFNKENSKEIFFYAGLIYLTSLATYWIFNQPNYFFVASYASVPWVIYIVLGFVDSKEEKFSAKLILKYLFYLYILLLFLQTSINLVVFLLLLGIVFLISCAIKSFDPKTTGRMYLKILLITSVPLVIYLIGMQVGLLYVGNYSFVLKYIYEYYTNIVSNPLTESVTQDLRASGYYRNSFVNNLLFTNSWMETHSSKGLLFENYKLYSGGLFRVIGLLPFTISVFSIFLFSSEKSKNAIKLHMLLFLSLLLMSTLVLRITDNVPFLSEIFRWSSSKFWTLYLIPLSLIVSISTPQVLKSFKLKFLFVILLLVYIFPVFTGNLFSEQLVVDIPNEYVQLDKEIDREKAYFYLPTPNSTYFYEYKWGYFGSDIVGYLTSGNYYDRGVISYFDNFDRYQKVLKVLTECKDTDSTNEYIIYDLNIDTDRTVIKNCLDMEFDVVKVIDNIIVYSK